MLRTQCEVKWSPPSKHQPQSTVTAQSCSVCDRQARQHHLHTHTTHITHHTTHTYTHHPHSHTSHHTHTHTTHTHTHHTHTTHTYTTHTHTHTFTSRPCCLRRSTTRCARSTSAPNSKRKRLKTKPGTGRTT